MFAAHTLFANIPLSFLIIMSVFLVKSEYLYAAWTHEAMCAIQIIQLLTFRSTESFQNRYIFAFC